MKILIILLAATAFGSSSDQDPRLLVHILDYIAADYPGAVEKGKVVSKEEYDEQKEFAAHVRKIGKENLKLQKLTVLQDELAQIETLILGKKDSKDIATLCRKAETRAIEATGLDVAPKSWPNIAKGKTRYEATCTQCHGVTGKGDGPSSTSLNPPPSNFHASKMDSLPPFQVFNTIRLGVNGTGMAGYPSFSDDEVWDLSFYVVSLRHEGKTKPMSVSVTPGSQLPSLKEVATLSDNDLRKRFAEKTVAEIRLRTGDTETAQFDSLSLARSKLSDVLGAARKGDFDTAKRAAIDAYLEGIEPVETMLRAKDPLFVAELERKMALVRGTLHPGAEATTEGNIVDALKSIDAAEKLLSEKNSSPTFVFFMTLGIVLREAFEAILIIIMFLGVIRSIGSKSAALAVHLGWISALGIGVIAWFSSQWVLSISGLGREMMEATISFLAVAILLYFGIWLHSHLEITKWKVFLSEVVKKAAGSRELLALGMASFMAVFREAFETVLFLRALLIESGSQYAYLVGLGVLTAVSSSIVATAIVLKLSVRLPLRQLFSISSVLMLALSLVLLGKGIHSLQEAGVVSISPLGNSFRIDLLGVYPTYETWLGQILLLALITGFWFFNRWRNSLSSCSTTQ